MKHTPIISAVFVCLLVISACKKDEPAAPQMTTRVGNIYSDSSNSNTLYYYSPSFLIKGYYDNLGKYNYLFQYANGESQMKVSTNGLYAYSVAYFWNGSGLADSSVQVGTNGGINIRRKYEYDAGSFLTGVKWYNSRNELVLTENFSVAGNNITQHTYNVIDSTDASLPTGTSTYEYHTDKANTLSNLYFGRTYLGTSSVNAVKSWTYTDGVTTSKVNYAYHYESERISSQIIYADSSGANGAQIDSLSFSYYVQ
jgi:hypothetical protein